MSTEQTTETNAEEIENNTVNETANDNASNTENVDASEQADNVSIESLTEKVALLEKEVTDTKARANADMYNFQKRLERETDNTKKFAIEKFAKDLLEVVDNLERAIESAQKSGASDDDATLQGVTLTHKSLLTMLEKHKVIMINPASGDDFNPDLHQAVGVDPNSDSGKVGNLLQKGYQLQDRLLRPAMVMVGQ